MEIDQSTESNEAVMEVNTFARRSRHFRVFSRYELVKIHALDFLRWSYAPVKNLFNTRPFQRIRGAFSYLKALLFDLMPVSPQRRLLAQTGILLSAIILTTSLSTLNVHGSANLVYSSDYIDSYALPGDILVADDDGYLVKINPQTNVSNRIGMTDYAVHTVETGESLSVIAERYGVAVETVMWENNLVNANSLRIGQKLLIPPVDGVSYTAASGDSLEKIATKYDISVESIIAQNGLESDVIAKGQKLFLPGAEPIMPVSTVGSSTYATTTASRTSRSYSSSTATPTYGKIFIFPTTGSITQGYKAGHYAIDIADRSMPPVWAAATGTVTKVSTGTWGGGYGNHVIIDHGNGMQTLYAHLDSVNVSQGQEVSQGDVIGVMGNTGRVYGATGIHLHWECIENGVKQYCGNYY